MTDPTREVSDRYEIVRLLGEGASAETYLAKDKQNGDQLVAIKSLRIEKMEGWKFFELFEREAQTLETLDHPGIPDFIETFASKDENGPARFHLVQEYVEGHSLEHLLKSGFSQEGFDQLVTGLLEILTYLHERTPPIFHRDIKPSNIIVRATGEPVLIDFGSVCFGWRESIDRGSTVAGTHGYMPPEQYLGQVSARSDLYGLGATLLHVASGRAPSDFSFEEGRLNVPADLPLNENAKRAIQKMLEPAPKDRPKSAVETIELYLSQQSTALAPVAPHALAAPNADGVTPLFIDLGDPPRTIDGPFEAAYQTMVPRLTSMSMGGGSSSKGGRRANWPFFILMMACTFGFGFLILAIAQSERKRRRKLFEEGVFTKCQILGSSSSNQQQTRVTYQFEAGSSTIRGSSILIANDASHLVAGDVLGVLFDANNPNDNVIVYV